jgi:large subunit ribosomal protein L2
MPIKVYKPTTSGRRHSSVDAFTDVTKREPEKSLTTVLRPKSGRNNQGKITVRHKSGGAKKLYRLVDFKQKKFDVPAEVIAIEYDPNRGPRVALIKYEDGEKSYVLAPANLNVGDTIVSSDKAVEAKNGTRMPLEFMPVGVFVYNIELTPGKGGQLVRGAGLSAQLVGFEGEYALLKLPSGEIRKVRKQCAASVGALGNADRRLIRWGKAGRMRHRGIKPTVKGKNMNPVDHPHGGGEGRSKGNHPQSPWGQPAKGYKTRGKKPSDHYIVSRRPKGKR